MRLLRKSEWLLDCCYAVVRVLHPHASTLSKKTIINKNLSRGGTISNTTPLYFIQPSNQQPTSNVILDKWSLLNWYCPSDRFLLTVYDFVVSSYGFGPSFNVNQRELFHSLYQISSLSAKKSNSTGVRFDFTLTSMSSIIMTQMTDLRQTHRNTYTVQNHMRLKYFGKAEAEINGTAGEQVFSQ